MLALGRRELTLVMRSFVVYKAKTIQVAVMGLIAATLFLRTHIHPISPNDGQEIAGFLYFATLIMLFNGIAELTLTVCSRSPLPVYFACLIVLCALAKSLQNALNCMLFDSSRTQGKALLIVILGLACMSAYFRQVCGTL